MSIRYIAILAIAGLTLGCSGPRILQADAVTVAPNGFWISGTEGVAAFSDGRTLVRRDYPRASHFEWAYEPFAFPASWALMIRGEPWLVTRPGELLKWSERRWVPIAAHLPPIDSPIQIDIATMAPDGSLLLHVHSDVLLWAPPGELGSRWIVERLPSYFDWIGFDGDALIGLGWRGSLRVVVRRSGAGQWSEIEELGDEGRQSELLGVVRIPGGPLAAVVSSGLIVVGDGPRRFVPIADLLAGIHPAPRRLAIAIDPSSRAIAASPRHSKGVATRSPGGVAASTNAPSPTVSSSYLRAAFPLTGRGPVLVVGGGQQGILELDATRVAFTPCASPYNIIGAVDTPAGIRLVTNQASVLAFRSGQGCGAMGPPAIPLPPP